MTPEKSIKNISRSFSTGSLGVIMFEEQIARTQRCYYRWKCIDEGRVHDMESENYRDEMVAFFQNCYHIKDWLINASSGQFPKEKVEAFIDENPELQLCADLCNASKHFKLDRPRSTQEPKTGPQKIHLLLGSSQPQISVRYTIETISGPKDAFMLAGKCLELWRSFISA
jgi:hypothetical protein